jgi:ubiquinone/menaquinone biosynthesis C-methylase UbiE
LLSNCQNKDILEYGCGLSSYSYFLARNGALSAKAIDISDVAIEQAREKAVQEGLQDKMEFLVMDAEKLEFGQDSFDLICGNGIIHHLDLNKAYAELSRTIKPDGIVVFTEPLGHNPLINLFRKLTPGRTEDEHPLLVQDIELAKKYFNSVETTYFYLSTLALSPFRKLSFFQQMVKFTDGLDKALFRLFPFLKKHAWMIVIILKDPKRN